jgi:hypothetical protein
MKAAVEQAVRHVAAGDGVVFDAVVADVGEVEVAADEAVAERRDAVLDVVDPQPVDHVPARPVDPQSVPVVAGLVLHLLPGQAARLLA